MSRWEARLEKMRSQATNYWSYVSSVLSLVCLLSSVFCLLSFSSAGAESAGSLVNRGNELYGAGDYDQALAAYEQALTDQPDVGEVWFNKGNVVFSERRVR